MKSITTLIVALAATSTFSSAQTSYRHSSRQVMSLDGYQTVLSDNARALSASGVFDAPAPALRSDNAPRKAPSPLGGSFTDWELLGKARFNAELGVVEPCDVDVWYCTTDPSGMGMGVDSYHIEGVFTIVLPFFRPAECGFKSRI
ncbi:MAG: hypothetical protein Q4C34_07005, partial [Bacteroidales bacterium]|nr:hypothetical protein [Bacteroidales bacterium]